MTESFQIISTGLLTSQMGVDAHITSCATQRFPFAIWNMLFCFWIAILFGHSKVDYMDDVSSLGVWSTYQKIVRLDVSVYQILLVNSLYT